jgi:hypothetical protein
MLDAPWYVVAVEPLAEAKSDRRVILSLDQPTN